ncbi:DUF2515 family protein [Bacillus solimangrovi]|nr:DUF2515 family protein [Bacillus solimangrovi]
MNNPKSLKLLSSEEYELISKIKSITKQFNANNIIRTQAYLDFYQKHPEIEWSLLAHLVSRNAGWNMTDLKGEFLPKLLSEKKQRQFFLFLERANWLIFQDVYPQLLLYKESLQRNKPLFYLLPYFNVSSFIQPFWNYFWSNKNRYFLTTALIINEQNYIEKRVVQNQIYTDSTLHSFTFKLQEHLNFSHVLLPYQDKGALHKVGIIGQTLHHFESLDKRIKFGKRLYTLLYFNQARLNKIVDWAISNPHSGSRKDYWPHLFNDVKESLPGKLYKPRTNNCTLKKGAKRLYSPKLQFVWKDISHIEATQGDWFEDYSVINNFKYDKNDVNEEITHAYCESIKTLELIMYLSEVIFHVRE